MMPLTNIDLLSVAIAFAANVILGFIAFFSNRKSISNKSFLFLTLSASVWSVVNYLSYQSSSPEVIIWLFRLILFFAVWYCFALFQFFYVFPRNVAAFPRWYTRALIPSTVAIAIFTLSPFALRDISQLKTAGQVSVAQPGFGIAIFGAFIFFLVIGAFVALIKNLHHAERGERITYKLILAGAILTFSLHLTFNFVFPVIFNITRFLTLGGVSIFPLIAFATYAIVRHHFLDLKVFAAQALTFVLAIITFAEVVVARGTAAILVQTAIFLLVLIFGVLLIRSVLREIRQREELERLYKQLEEKNKQLDDLSHFKSELLSLASHQIRSPLAAIKGFLSLVMDGTYGAIDPRAKEALAKTQRSADELIGLINTLLDLRKVEEGKMDYQFAKTDLKKLADDVVALLRPLAETKKLEFTLASPEHEMWVNADAEKLKQVIQNLTDNAIKYTPNGFVRVELKEENGSAVVTVSDSGLGISPTLVPHLFEEFIRDERVKKEIRGTGLGLYIARRIAEAHGGKVWAESAGEGKGSAFHLSLPVLR